MQIRAKLALRPFGEPEKNLFVPAPEKFITFITFINFAILRSFT